MVQRWTPAAFVRGGTSKGLFFDEADLPADAGERDALFLSALGSPDLYGRQLDGMGGGLSSLSKAVTVTPSIRPGVDVEYTFAQISVDKPVVDYAANCGNLASAVGPYAVDQGMVQAADGPVSVRIYNTNTNKVIVAHFEVSGGVARTDGTFAIPGVSGTGAPVKLEFLDPGGARTGRLLPTGMPTDHLSTSAGRLLVSLVDATNPVVFVRADSVGLSGHESVGELEANTAALAVLDEMRRQAAVAMGLCSRPEGAPLSNPKIAIISAPRDYMTLSGLAVAASSYDIAIRMISVEQVHRAITVTGALCTAVAQQIPGTLVAQVAEPRNGQLRVGSPSGVFEVAADVVDDAGELRAQGASLYRTCRRLMQGAVATPGGADIQT
ncbi:2-methylaconitate cis-trans isomerase PrpF family protein [Rhodococcoides fascians]|uniref:2-methylaconitate cis-trans isomerase PrpF family protein n=1 Tax=Rhodococcoides fascians TaxID=1828 RepID=UPI00055B33F9|nr:MULTISPECIES: PrpF domain-containing protein [Rhodococcus]OZF01390.1 PrpF family protein [Rhodococcus sp. 15-1189-1-1a]OZF15611.1 PrpF family protein [Rhodococcus sp. 14-2686-1-2]